MRKHVYLSMTPESLVMSMLPPRDFGAYLAVGTQERARGPAMFLDLKEDFAGEGLDLADAAKRCEPHADGQPKRSVYVAIYRVLERVPLEAVNHLWLVTIDGRVLELSQGPVPSELPGKFHLYREICPVVPLIGSSLAPEAFCRHVTNPARAISVPRICFAELELAGLADDPRCGSAGNLPYWYLEHLRDCLEQLSPTKAMKTVERVAPEEFHYRCVKNGFFLGDQQGLLYYPFPSRAELESEHYVWWRSANAGFGPK